MTMFGAVLASTALLASVVLAGDFGSAVVVNQCDYPVYLANTPSAGGGYSAISKTLNKGDIYSQQYTQLSNGNGWSLKLSKNLNMGSNIMQYEYTVHDDGMLWYDISDVDGNPFDANWEIVGSPGCNPRHAAYRFSTDDAYGMQACGQSATVTVTLCSGDNGGAAPAWPQIPSIPSIPIVPSIPSFGQGSPFSAGWGAPQKSPAPVATVAPVAPIASIQPTHEAPSPFIPKFSAILPAHTLAAVNTPTTLATIARPSTTEEAGSHVAQVGADGLVKEADHAAAGKYAATVVQWDVATVVATVTASPTAHAYRRHSHHGRRHHA